MDDPDLRKRLADPKTDITDYFNYGLNERTWRLLCEKTVQLASKTEKFINEEGTSKVLPDKLPLEFGGFGTPHFDIIKELPFFTMLKRHRERFFAQFKKGEERYYHNQQAHLGLQEQLKFCLGPEQTQTYAEVKNCYNQVAPGLLEMKQPLPTSNPAYKRPQASGLAYARLPPRGIPGSRPYDQNLSGTYGASAGDSNHAGISTGHSTAAGSDGASTYAGYRSSNPVTSGANIGYSRSANEGTSGLGHSAQFAKLKPAETSGSKTISNLPQSGEKVSRSRSRSSDRYRDSKEHSKKKRDRDSRDRLSRERRGSSRDRKAARSEKTSKRSRSRSKSADKHSSRASKKHSDRDERRKKDDRSSRDRKDKKDKETRDRPKASGKDSSRRRDRSSDSRSSRGSQERGKKSGGHRSPKKVEKTSIHDRIQVRK